jgi:hypothetical protein
MGVSVLGAIIVQLATGAFVRARTVHEDKKQDASGYVIASEVALKFSPYAIPLAAFFVIGLASFVWPKRRPPIPPQESS